MRATIKELYTYSQTNALPLLGSNSLDFWQEYLESYSIYDRYFRDSFLKFYYWMDFDDTDTTQAIYSDFIGAVQAHLLVNKKRYSELYKVHTLADNAYDIVNNYDLTETTTRTNTGTVTNDKGAQSNSFTKGATTATDVYGAETRTIEEGAQSNSHTQEMGEQSNSKTESTGAQENTQTNKVSPFDSSDFNNDTQRIDSLGSRDDSTSETIGARSDSSSDTIGAKTTSDTTGSKTDTHSTTEISDSEALGSRTDLRTDNLTETITTNKSGNIGVQTAAEIIGGHIDLWERFNFFKYVFDEIAKEFLIVSDDYDISSSATASSSDVILEAIAALSAKMDDIEDSINANIDAAEANIIGEITEVSTDGY